MEFGEGVTPLPLYDRQIEGNAITLALTAFTISNLVAWCFMIIVQYFVFKVLYSKPANTSIAPPTTLETYLLVAGLWVAHRVLDGVLYGMMDMGVCMLASKETLERYEALREGIYHLGYWTGGWGKSWMGNGIVLLGMEVLATWLLSQTLLLISDTLIPLVREIRRDRRLIGVLFWKRLIEVEMYMRTINWRGDIDLQSSAGLEGHEELRPRKQCVKFERQRNGPEEGQRSLDWMLVIDREALNEMMESLGPPGGFGELGFSVGKDKVSFGAMGIGTSFTLTFRLEAERRRESKGDRDKCGKGDGNERKGSRGRRK
ncbi:hypothetical protein CJF32_00001598 [Rutstroemia sp. NJR-2017a WRK4]|nr:hypothetical protein CJF32_00001598 [Rutstroemia sp. NJR-2017a WRK4]